MTTGLRRAWRHVKYTSSDLRHARERAEQNNAMVRRSQELQEEFERTRTRHGLGMSSLYGYGGGTITDPDLAEPRHPRWHDGNYGWKLRYVLGTGIVVVVALIAMLGLGFRQLAHNVDHRECPRKAAAMGIQAQWVDYSFFGWECLANVEGRWVPIDTVHNDTGVYIRGGGGQ